MRKMIEKEEKEEVSWNLSQIIIIEIGNNLRIASDLYYHRRFFDCFMKLKTISMRIIPYIDLTEKSELKKIEKQIFFINGKCFPIKQGFTKLNEEMIKSFFDLRLNVDKYNNFLLFLLKEYGLLIQMREDRTKITA